MKTSKTSGLLKNGSFPEEAKTNAVIPVTIRTEEKYYLNALQFRTLEKKCGLVLSSDPFSGSNGTYTVRSLYFDTPSCDHYYEKELGACDRNKIRLRTYLADGQPTKVFHLEEKRKRGAVTSKVVLPLTREQMVCVAAGDYQPLKNLGQTGLYFYAKLMSGAMQPVSVIQYERAALAMPLDELRVTFDRALRHSGFRDADWSLPPRNPVYAGEVVIMEIKYNKFIPAWLRSSLLCLPKNCEAISKYSQALGRFL